MAFSSRGAGGPRTQTALADINITPLVDVVLVLLLIFMLTAPVLQSGIEVAIPHTRSTATLTEERMVVTIDKDQNVYLQSNGADKLVNVNQLGGLLAMPGKQPAEKTVYVRADERVPFGAFATVMESIKTAGVTNISVVTQPFEK
jgi:biopolymer transport protein ExbD/biopolymer transport protein TolR